MIGKQIATFFQLLAIAVVLTAGNSVLAQEHDVLVRTGMQLQSKDKTIATLTIENDIKIITENAKVVKEKLRTKEIIKDKEVSATVLANWIQLRVGAKALKSNQPLAGPMWVAHFDKTERCFINSVPEQEAEIFIEGVKHPDTTNSVIGFRVDNTFKIRIKKGVKSAEGELKVTKGGKNTFEGELK